MVIVHIIAWVYGWVVQEKYTANPPSYDWEDKGFVEGFFVILLWGTFLIHLKPGLHEICLIDCFCIGYSKQALQSWLYYLVSTMADNISELGTYILYPYTLMYAPFHILKANLTSPFHRNPPWTREFRPSGVIWH